MADLDFEVKLAVGQIGESRIANWLKRRGNSVLPVYDIEVETGKGPRLFAPTKDLVAPDMLVFRDKNTIWIEAKHKEAFTWHRITSEWVTGINLRHYFDYCEIDDYSPFPVWLLFLQNGGQAKDSPPDSPSGLYGNTLQYLRNNEHHRWEPGGMVYWGEDHLKKLAKLDEL